MRIHKYRCWDKEKKRMLYEGKTENNYTWNYLDKTFCRFEQNHQIIEMIKKPIIMKYTGLRDINSKMIWGDDIVYMGEEEGISSKNLVIKSGHGKSLYIIKFYELAWRLDKLNSMRDIDKGLLLSPYAMYYPKQAVEGNKSETLIVIGNIYEDKKLSL